MGKELLVFCILVCLAIALAAQEGGEEVIFPTQEEVVAFEESVASDSVFKYFWQFPNYRDRYPIAERFPQLELNGGGVAYAGYEYGYNKVDEAEKQGAFGYAAFRPFILDFPHYDIAFGVSFLGSFGKTRVADVDVDLSDDVITLTAGADGIEVHSDAVSINFSSLIVFPEQGFQISFDIGHMWLSLDLEMNIDFDIDIPDILLIDGAMDGYDYKQRDRALYVAIGFDKFYDRNFFSHFNFTFRWIFNLDTEARDAFGSPNLTVEVLGEEFVFEAKRQKLPAFLDLQQGREVDINVISGNALARLFTIPTDLPIPTLGQLGISVSALAGLEHRTGEASGEDIHGLRIIAGGVLSVFEIFNIVYSYTWEEHNDMEDEWNIRIVVGLYGGSGVTDGSSHVVPNLQPNPTSVAQ